MLNATERETHARFKAHVISLKIGLCRVEPDGFYRLSPMPDSQWKGKPLDLAPGLYGRLIRDAASTEALFARVSDLGGWDFVSDKEEAELAAGSTELLGVGEEVPRLTEDDVPDEVIETVGDIPLTDPAPPPPTPSAQPEAIADEEFETPDEGNKPESLGNPFE